MMMIIMRQVRQQEEYLPQNQPHTIRTKNNGKLKPQNQHTHRIESPNESQTCSKIKCANRRIGKHGGTPGRRKLRKWGCEDSVQTKKEGMK